MTLISSQQVDALAAEVISSGFAKVQIRLAEITFESEVPSGATVDVNAAIGIDAGWELKDGGQLGRIILNVRYTLTAAMVEDDPSSGEASGEADAGGDESEQADPPPVAWECAVEMQGQWIFVDPPKLTAEHIRAFAVRVGIMSIHPYARSHVQSLVAESGWALFTMDVLTNVDEIFAAAGDPNMLDLEGITVEFD